MWNGSSGVGLNEWPNYKPLLWRTGVDVSNQLSHLQTQLSGFLDYTYRNKRSELLLL